jgi:hypothetical protein
MSEERFDRIEHKLDVLAGSIGALGVGVYNRFAQADERFDGIDRRFDGVDQRFDRVDQRFDRVDEHLVLVDEHLVRIVQHLVRVDASILSLVPKTDRIERTVDSIAETQSHINDELSEHLKRHERRISALEARQI